MTFWKNLFGNGDTATAGQATSPQGEMLEAAGELPDGGRIVFSTTRDIDLYELEELCDAVGWARRPMRKVGKAIQYSFLVVSMWELQGSRRRLVGFARATSDHAFNATIWDVVVHPKLQSKGFGKALMRYAIAKLRREDISNITLFADAQVVDFYRRLGFVLDPEGIKGMFWYPD
ncbi:putative acetyltransferase [Rubidibacter lacunae KORDI 51-2]|uniref:Putative acetyltransferase n=1 Tax=Rubidibacter lacunae KORDI 51-2 TaxID=582515 RepID=U5DA93_9CHRO|nr:GNAT family N-acetyltransferase [Rubidibacter lacunae]ERN41498.1 putative acetyltransferase [Rubidibacter lacunae KORDI 51-2]